MNAAKKNLLKYLKDISGFEVTNSSSDTAPEGLTGELLYNLFDIGLKFSTDMSARGGVVFKVFLDNTDIGIVMELFESSKNEKIGRDTFLIAMIRGSGIQIIEGDPIILELENGIGVVWDSELEVHDLEALVETIDEFAKKNLQIRKGERLMIPLGIQVGYN